MNGKLTTRLAAGTLSAMVALALAACSSPGGGDPGSGGTGTTAPAAPASAPATRAASHTKAAGALSGTWSGHYSGAYSGNFTVRWRQSGSRLHGTIHLSNPGDTLPINGTVNGSSISFGTVGSTAITYTGTVSGNSMSGSYKVHTTNGATGGPWSAAKS